MWTGRIAAVLAVATLMLGPVMLAGCASTPARRPEGPITGVARDKQECEVFGDAQSHHHGGHRRACMVARGHAVVWEFNKLNWIVGVQTVRPHADAFVVKQELTMCELRADGTKNADVVSLTPEQEATLSPAYVASDNPFLKDWAVTRTNASRTLVKCLSEHGYTVVPLNGGGR